jgi:hypothetical protein
VVDAEGRLVGIGGVQQRVQLALTTTRGTSLLTTLGLAAWPDVITDAIEAQIGDAVRTALKKLIASGEVTVAGIDITRPKSSAVSVRVRWIDTSTGLEHTQSV